MMNPFPVEPVKNILARAERIVCFDGNYSGQLAQVIRAETGVNIHHRVVKYDGRPFSEDEIMVALEASKADAPERLVISQGRVIEAGYGNREFDEMVLLRGSNPKMLAPMVPLPPGYNR
jgi:hypothetical protein